MTQLASRTNFLSQLYVQHGPRQSLSLYFAFAVGELRVRGIELEFGTFDALERTNAANRQSWLPLTPTFNPQYNTLTTDNAFCLLGRDAAGEIVLTHAGRRFDWTQSSFKTEAEALRLFYDLADAAELAGESCEVTAPTADKISGVIAYTGAVWNRPDVRGRGLPNFVSRLARAYALTTWNIDFAVAMMSERNVSRGLVGNTGHSNLEGSVKSLRSPLGDVTYQLAWATPTNIMQELSEHLSLSRGDGRAVHQRHA
ncbi:MAG: hypothetical protein ACKVP7_24725 [Hyphomicrobiaceae bacterium]